MKIRTANKFDAEGIAKTSAVFGYGQPLISDVVKQLAEIEASITINVWVCEIGNEVVGWIHAEKVTRLASKPFIEIIGIVVSTEFQKRGAGSKLVKEVTGWAASLKMDVRVRTNENRVQAIKFYTKSGFKNIKKQQVLQWYL